MTTRKVADAGPAVDTSLARHLDDAMRPLRGARQLANDTGRRDDARDLGVVIATLATAARRIDNRATRARTVIQFRAATTNETEDA